MRAGKSMWSSKNTRGVIICFRAGFHSLRSRRWLLYRDFGVPVPWGCVCCKGAGHGIGFPGTEFVVVVPGCPVAGVLVVELFGVVVDVLEDPLLGVVYGLVV